MHQLSKITTNVKNLFLRNIETVLISENIMCSCSLEKFRNEIAPFVLHLLDSYVNDLNKNSNSLLKSQYIQDTFALRKHVENLSQSTDHVHY